MQNHTTVTTKTPATVNFVSSQSERTVTTDVGAGSANLISTQRHNMSNITQSINTNTTKFGSAGQNALCSTERFSEEVRYKQSQKSLNAPSSDNLSQQTLPAQGYKNQTMKLRDNQGGIIEKRHYAQVDGPELDQVGVKDAHQMSAGKARKQKQELAIMAEGKKNLLYEMNDYDMSKTTKAQSIVCPIYQSKDFRLISQNNKQQVPPKARGSGQSKQREQASGQASVKRGERVRQGTRGSSRGSEARKESEDKHEDVYMARILTKNPAGKSRKKMAKSSSISDKNSDKNQKHLKGKGHYESHKQVNDWQLESSGSAIDIDKYINQFLEQSNSKAHINQNNSNASGSEPLSDKLLYLTNQAHQTKIKSKSQLMSSQSSSHLRKKISNPAGTATGSQSTLQEPSARALPTSSNMKISRKFNKFEQSQQVKLPQNKQNLFQITKQTKKNQSGLKSDNDSRASPDPHKPNNQSGIQKQGSSSQAALPRQLMPNEIKHLAKKIKSPSPNVKFSLEQAQRLRSPDPVASNNILDQLRQGEGKKIVLEKRRLSQKRISEASGNQLNATSKVATSKSILQLSSSLGKSKRHSIDNTNAAGAGGEEAKQLYCRIDSRKNSQSSLQNTQGLMQNLFQIVQSDGMQIYSKVSPDSMAAKKSISDQVVLKNNNIKSKQKERSKDKEATSHFKIKPAGFLSQSPKAKKTVKGGASFQQLLNASGNSNNQSGNQGKSNIEQNLQQQKKFVMQMQTAYKSANIDGNGIGNLKQQLSVSPAQKALMQITAPKQINVQSPPTRILIKASSPRTSPNPAKQANRRTAVQTCKVSIEVPQGVKVANNQQTTKTRPTSKDIIKQIKIAKRIASNSPTPIPGSRESSPHDDAMPLKIYDGVRKYIAIDKDRHHSPDSLQNSANSKQRLTKFSKSNTLKVLSALGSPNQVKLGNKSPKQSDQNNASGASQKQGNRDSHSITKLIRSTIKSPKIRQAEGGTNETNASGDVPQGTNNFSGRLDVLVKPQMKQMLSKPKQQLMPQSVKNSASQSNLIYNQGQNFSLQKPQNQLKKSQLVVPGQFIDESQKLSASQNPNSQSVGLFKKPLGVGQSIKASSSKQQTSQSSVVGQGAHAGPFNMEQDSMPRVQEVFYDEERGDYVDMHRIDLEEIQIGTHPVEKQSSIVVLSSNMPSKGGSAGIKKEKEKIQNSGVMLRSDVVPPQLNHQSASKQCKKATNRQSLIKDKDMKRTIHKQQKGHAKSGIAGQGDDSQGIFRAGHEFSDSIRATSIPPDNSESLSSENILRRSAMVGQGQNVTQMSNEANREQAIYNRDLVKLCKMIRLHFKQFQTAPPTTSEFYRIGRVLGKGAFGKVSLALHKLSEQLVAIKSMSKEDLKSEEDLKRRTKLEMGILKQCNHQHVVKLYDTFETEKHICFVIELCSGGDLFSYIKKRRRLKENVAQFFFKQIVEGLAYIHNAKKVVHRDIKLENILLDATGNVKICDFGVSRQLATGEEQMMQQCGTPAYIAPEILKDQGYSGFKVDMWSAGVCLYAMLIGSVPFKAQTMSQLQSLILNGKYDFKFQTHANSNKPNNPLAASSLLSEGVQDLIAKLLTVDPNKRYSAVQALDHPWLRNAATEFDVYTEKEKQLIQKEYLRLNLKKSSHQRLDSAAAQSNCSRRQVTSHSAVQETEQMLFTEHNLETKLGDDEANQGNQEEKSYILAPFNSIKSMFVENGNPIVEQKKEDPPFEWPKEITELIVARKVIKFSAKCREKNRIYEQNNNADLDNGVYNEFVNEQEREEGALMKGSLKDENESDNASEQGPDFQDDEKRSIPSIESSDQQESEDSLQKSFGESVLSSDDEKAEKQLNEAHKQWTSKRQNEQAIDLCNNSADEIEGAGNKFAAVTAQQKVQTAPKCSPAIPAAQASTQKKPATVKPGSLLQQVNSQSIAVQYIEPEFIIDYAVVSQIQHMGIIPEWYLLAELQTLTNKGKHNQQLPPIPRQQHSNNQTENGRRMNYVTATYFLLCKRKELMLLHEKHSTQRHKELVDSDRE